MKLLTSIYVSVCVALGSVLFQGCSLVSCNHAFPKAEWYWSADAKACRAEKAHDKVQQTIVSTNKS